LSTLPESSFICDQCTIFTKDILKALRLLNPTDAVTALEVEFVLDDNQHIWLSRAPRVKCQSAPSLNSEIGTQPNHNHQISCHLLSQSYQILPRAHAKLKPLPLPQHNPLPRLLLLLLSSLVHPKSFSGLRVVCIAAKLGQKGCQDCVFGC
jgi:hypothetical protein